MHHLGRVGMRQVTQRSLSNNFRIYNRNKVQACINLDFI
jgi:hypothetical protein